MATLLEVPLMGVLPETIHDYQVRYPNARLRIEAENAIHTGLMDEDQFWAIIDLLDWEKESNQDILQPALEKLANFSKNDICTFNDILNAKLFALDGRQFAENLGSNAFKIENKRHFSVDDFLYSRCGVVGNGRQFFEEVLAKPNQIPKEFTFEALIYLPERAWKLQSGVDNYDYFPTLSYETFSNIENWPGLKPLNKRLRLRN
jgi:hypothetical protein